ncbi:uncharacterized protein OCT59_023895 [Rhizophagus irregularis]|uniref:Tpk1p n=4 Tax=Rhizophagus irregularis TaxID=588596 RepID=A0A015I0I3_RHIIW|nr:kinase-like domain-containing protein [Rhizophagus irregularis DAOM 181602=DAOM 197198]EXX50442.1 Tpk1p [Rhizophagus irregularis DAOM 197198w]POG66382.1 kinase-like domain-containing protein [Rhizophagus irregularis DAOM 181602=DAOM 197198]UZO03488.1 hypothetical protein OCT59_023895 [Rhizophagus irregularis]|eukprot:XP_025173248.1 kinase-like domain-containing protein [Rhizophagus irregularis DAOM 181602=DAOM 197198]
MSDIKNNKVTVNTNEWINWIEENIFKNNLKYYDYNDFLYIEKFCNGNFGNFYRVKWKNSDHYFILKSFNIDNVDIKEIVQEIKLYREIDSHENIINFCGITNKENHNDQAKEYLLVMEDVDGRSLRSYLKENFKNLTWEDKYKLAYQLTYTISFLHDKGIIHGDLNSGNILVHRNTTIKLVDLGLSNRIKEISKQSSDLLDKIPYIDPKCLIVESNNIVRSFIFNEKSDVYSIGVLLWEISSGKSPFEGKLYDSNLVNQILQGYRETIVSNTPLDYSNLYIECWNGESDNRPVMNQIISKLREIIKIQTDDNEKLDNNHNNNNDLFKESQKIIIQNFDKIYLKEIKETEPTIQYIHKNISEEDLGIVIDELMKFYLQCLNKGKEEYVIRRYILNYFNNQEIKLQEIYNWLLNNNNNNQNDSNSIYLLGYFNYHGIITCTNKHKAYELYQKAVELENVVAQLVLASIYIEGKGIKKNYNKAFELSKKLAKVGNPNGINRLGYCYSMGIGTEINMKKAFKLYQKAADLGNIRAQCNLINLYLDGDGTEKDYNKAFELAKKSAEDHSDGMNLLGYCYNNGIGTNIDKKKAFELFQEAAKLECCDAQYNLALMYEDGEGIKQNIDQAIYWYKKSANQGFQSAQNKLKYLGHNN